MIFGILVLALCGTRECEDVANWFQYTYTRVHTVESGRCEADHRTHTAQLVHHARCATDPTSQWAISCFSCNARSKFKPETRGLSSRSINTSQNSELRV